MTSQQRAEGIVNGQNFDCIMSKANSESLKRHIIEALDQSRQEGFEEAVEKCLKICSHRLSVEEYEAIRNLKVKP